MKIVRALLPVLLAVLPLQGCKVPDIKPFAGATTQMTSALSEGFGLVQGNLDAATKLGLEAPLQQRLVPLRDSFRVEAADTRKVLAALDRYAKTLVDVSESGDKGQATRNKIADAIGGIAGAIPVTAPFSSAITGTLTEINAIVSKIRTLNKLGDALDQADEAIQKIAGILDEQILAHLIKVDSAAGIILIAHTTKANQVVTQPFRDFSDRQVRADAMVGAMLEFETLAARYQRAQLKNPTNPVDISKFRQELARQWEEMAPKDVELSKQGAFEARKLSALLELLEKREPVWAQRASAAPYFQARYDKAQAGLAAQKAALKQQHEVLVKSQSLVRSWATAHASLKLAVTNEKHAVSFQELFEEAEKLKQLIDNVSSI